MVVLLLNIIGLKVEKAEYCEAKGYIDMTLRSKEGVVRIGFKDNGDSLPMFLSDKEYDLTLVKHKENNKWSKSQLNYCWKLIVEMANILMTSKEEMYKELLVRYSQSEIIPIPKEDMSATLEEKGIKYYDILADRVIEGVPIFIIRWYAGIHQMSSHELNIFIEGVKSEAEEMGIDVSTPSEVARYG